MIDQSHVQCSFNKDLYRGLKNKLYAFMEENFSDQLKLSCCRILPILTLTTEERRIVRNAVDKRRYEFSAGRRCAKKCLGYSDITDFSLLKGEYGEPIWPQGNTGSITHHSGMAFAVTVPDDHGFVGIDFVDLSEKISGTHLILSDTELKANLAINLKNPELLLFSLKESVIKILSPALQKYIEFKDINIILENEAAEITYRKKDVGINLYWFIYRDYAFTVAIKNV